MREEAIPVSTAAKHVHYPALDGLRAIAVTVVFLWHYLQFPWGWAGVDTFFALSGFLITGILYDTRDAAHRFRNFYIRRTLRIFPLYYTVLLSLFALGLFLHWTWNPGQPLWLAYLGNFNSFFFRHHPAIAETQAFLNAQPGAVSEAPVRLGHFWSLCVEEQFYLVWPLLIFTIRNRVRLMQICAAVVVVDPLLRLAALHSLHTGNIHDIVAWSTPFRLDELLLGAMLALYLRGPKPASLHRWAVGLSAVGLIAMCVWGQPQSDLWLLTVGISLAGVVSIALVTLALEPKTILYRALQWRPLREIGKVSYGIYVFHDIPHTAYRDFLDNYNIEDPYAIAAFAFACTLAMAFLSYYCFEKYFLKLKDRYTR